MSMTLAARANHLHHVSARAPARPSALAAAPHLAPLLWFRRKLKARPGSTLAHCVFVIAAGMVLVNALAFQRQDSARSYAAEQAAAQAMSQSRTLQGQPAVPVPPVRPSELPATAPRVSSASSASPAAGAAVQQRQMTAAPAARDQQAGRDPIGDLIRSGQVAGSPMAEATRPATAAAALARPAAETRPVAAAQRALNRIGFGPVKADGLFGEETRAALERFERERRIPVTRDLSPRTLRELTAASGIRME